MHLHAGKVVPLPTTAKRAADTGWFIIINAERDPQNYSVVKISVTFGNLETYAGKGFHTDMIRFLQKDNRVIKGIFIAIIGLAVVTMVITLVPGIFQDSASTADNYATVRHAGLLQPVPRPFDGYHQCRSTAGSIAPASTAASARYAAALYDASRRTDAHPAGNYVAGG